MHAQHLQPRAAEDIAAEAAVAAADARICNHIGCAALEALAKERFARLRAELMAAHWSPEAAAEIARIHMEIYP